jgi:hypothetical protein
MFFQEEIRAFGLIDQESFYKTFMEQIQDTINNPTCE